MALFDDAVGSAEVFVHNVSDNRPAIGIAISLTLVFKVMKNIFAVLLDTLYVAEEGVALGFENVGCELTSGRSGGCRRVEGVEHGDAIGFTEWLQAHFVDQSLGSLYQY